VTEAGTAWELFVWLLRDTVVTLDVLSMSRVLVRITDQKFPEWDSNQEGRVDEVRTAQLASMPLTYRTNSDLFVKSAASTACFRESLFVSAVQSTEDCLRLSRNERHLLLGANCTNCSQMRGNSGRFGAISECFGEAKSTKTLNNQRSSATSREPALDIVGHDDDDVGTFGCFTIGSIQIEHPKPGISRRQS
jgi:hypothetical protein